MDVDVKGMPLVEAVVPVLAFLTAPAIVLHGVEHDAVLVGSVVHVQQCVGFHAAELADVDAEAVIRDGRDIKFSSLSFLTCSQSQICPNSQLSLTSICIMQPICF
jgi:hypothetical protein